MVSGSFRGVLWYYKEFQWCSRGVSGGLRGLEGYTRFALGVPWSVQCGFRGGFGGPGVSGVSSVFLGCLSR